MAGSRGNALPVAMTESGAMPFSVQLTTALSMSNWSSAGPPPQWRIPGTRRWAPSGDSVRTAVSRGERFVVIEGAGGNQGSLSPWKKISLPPLRKRG